MSIVLNEDDFYDDILAKAPEFVRDRQEADIAIARGSFGRPLDEILADLEKPACDRFQAKRTVT